jgi:hypothetical protein
MGLIGVEWVADYICCADVSATIQQGLDGGTELHLSLLVEMGCDMNFVLRKGCLQQVFNSKHPANPSVN